MLLTFDSEYEPFFTPPGWIIGPIWAVLYTMLAFSIYYTIMNRENLEKFNSAIFFFTTQLVLNLLWPSVFNSAEYLISLVIIILMIIFSVIYAFLTFKKCQMLPFLFGPTLHGLVLLRLLTQHIT